MMDQTDEQLVAQLVASLEMVNGMIAAIAGRGLHCEIDLVGVNTIKGERPPLITVAVERRERLGR